MAIVISQHQREESETKRFLKSDLLKEYPFVVCEWLHQHDIMQKKKRKTTEISAHEKWAKRSHSNRS